MIPALAMATICNGETNWWRIVLTKGSFEVTADPLDRSGRVSVHAVRRVWRGGPALRGNSFVPRAPDPPSRPGGEDIPYRVLQITSARLGRLRIPQATWRCRGAWST